jgi:phospholipase A1
VGVEHSLPRRQGAVEQRLEAEKKNVFRPFTIMPHRPNYILPVAYNSHGYNAGYHKVANNDPEYSFDPVEAQFQLSIKTPLVLGVFGDSTDIYAAYTNHSYWQVYNNDISAPFRETNHEPEMWIQFKPQWELFGIVNTNNSLGINHQSNGQSSILSRSWNRIFATIVLEYGDLALSVTPWYRIPESEGDDDNPDITRFMGHYELGATYKWDDHTFALTSRNGFESNYHRGSVQFSWSFPLGDWPFLRGYLQYYNGYGESLIDYDRYVNRVALGLSLTDWL